MSFRRHNKTFLSALAALGIASLAQGADQSALNRAYELLAQGHKLASLSLFQDYVADHPQDIQANLDLAGLLSQLNRHSEAADHLQALIQFYPGNETLQFKLAVEQVAMREFEAAQASFTTLLTSSNPAMAEAARHALVQAQKDVARQKRQDMEEEVFDWVRKFKTQEALEGINAIESTWGLSYPMALQRLYLLSNMGRFAEASDKAEQLSLEHPRDTNLAFLRAELFMALGAVARAERIWEKIEQDYPGSFAADEAKRRRAATRPTSTSSSQEKEVYRLAQAERFQEVIEAVDQMEVESGSVPFNMEMQRLYALYNLNYLDVALVEAEKLADRHPNAVDLSLLRAELLVKLEKPEEAKEIWEQIEREVPGSAAALEARRRKEALIPPENTATKEQRVFNLAAADKQREVVEAVESLESEDGFLSLGMELQRLYALYALQEFEMAQRQAEEAMQRFPDNTDLAFLFAEILVQRGDHEKAREVWKTIAENHAGDPDGDEASKRLKASLTSKQASPEEIRVFALAREQQYDQVVSFVDALEERGGTLTPALRMQRLYALMAKSQHNRALQEAEKISAQRDVPAEVSLIHAELLTQRQRWEEASLILRQLKRDHPEDPLYDEANRRLDNLPQVANLDRLHWGEAYASGDYYGRYDALVGSGFVRYGTFVPQARWLQPHAEFKFVVDTESETAGRPTIISDNHVGHYAGVRAQLFKREYVFLYAQAGVNRDLLDRRNDGDYDFDYQAGIYGFKSWGPGVVLRQPVESDFQFGQKSSDYILIQTNGFFWRGDWFMDASLNFSYYHRYASWLGYASAREGLRLFQIGPRLGFDAYAVQNLAWDVEGNYFDNFFELGPGVRWLWTPCPNAQIVLRTEWHYGSYLGRNQEQRGAAATSYDEIVAGISVGMRW